MVGSQMLYLLSFSFPTGGLDEPIQRAFVLRDWRFGHYEMDGLQDPFSRFLRFITAPFSRKKKNVVDLVEDGDVVPDLAALT